MKRDNTKSLLWSIMLGASLLLTGCNDYLNEIPKGQKTPTTWADYNAFVRTSEKHYFEMDQIYGLMGDLFYTPNQLNSNQLVNAHYFWNDTTDRTLINSTDKNAYYNAYEALFYANLIIEGAPTATNATDEQRNRLTAQGRVLRALIYHYLVNYYADQYTEDTKHLLGVPLATSSSVTSPSPQGTLEDTYRLILSDLEAAVPHLPQEGESPFHPTVVTAYGLLARTHLSMNNYDKALEYADKALAINDQLFDWVAFYQADSARYANPTNYAVNVNGNPERNNPENYLFRFGSMNMYRGNNNVSYALPPERAARFEAGDTRLLTHWKRRVSASGIVYYGGIYSIEPNKAGMRSPEMYYIKAECLARQGGADNINAAMALVNRVRKTRILPEHYTEWTATTTQEAVNKIIDDKASEYVQSQVIFCDYRRLNKTPEYARTLTKTVNGQTYTLAPTSHLWIMPFPNEAMSNPGNGTLQQNVAR